jgi:hypothetical protein
MMAKKNNFLSFPKGFIHQSNGDHPMSDSAHQKDFIRLATQWFKNGFNPHMSSTAIDS